MEERVHSHSILLRKGSKKQAVIEFFPAAQWKMVYRPGKKNVYPKPPSIKDDYWEIRYRIRVNGTWRKGRGISEKYHFFTMEEGLAFVGEFW